MENASSSRIVSFSGLDSDRVDHSAKMSEIFKKRKYKGALTKMEL